jgi:hypothetical protein
VKVNEFEYAANFDKSKIVTLANEIGKYLNAQGIGATLWSVHPLMLSFSIQTSRADVSEIICGLYLRAEVMHVTMAAEPNVRATLIQVFLTDRWFVEEKSDAGSKAKKHPEAEGGSLA